MLYWEVAAHKESSSLFFLLMAIPHSLKGGSLYKPDFSLIKVPNVEFVLSVVFREIQGNVLSFLAIPAASKHRFFKRFFHLLSLFRLIMQVSFKKLPTVMFAYRKLPFF